MNLLTLSVENFPKNFLDDDLFNQIYYLDEKIVKVSLKRKKLIINLSIKINKKNENELLSKILTFFNFKLKTFNEITSTKIFENHRTKFIYKKDPFKALIKNESLLKITNGNYAISKDFLLVMKSFDQFLLNLFKIKFKAEEHNYPILIPINSMIDNGYLKDFPHFAIFCTHISCCSNNLQNFQSNFNSNKKKIFSKPMSILAPSVCFHTFESLRNKKIKNIKIITAKNIVHRNEGFAYSNIKRLQSFNMREIIFFGKKKFVTEFREKQIKALSSIFSSWDLSFEIKSATDNFFSNNETVKKKYQSVFRTKYELDVYLPFDNSYLSSGSFNLHFDHLCNAYKIKVNSKDKLYSGCVGFGLERFVYSMFCQLGLNLKLWPKIIIKQLKLKV